MMISVKKLREVSNAEARNKIKMFRNKLNYGSNPGKGRKTWKQYFSQCQVRKKSKHLFLQLRRKHYGKLCGTEYPCCPIAIHRWDNEYYQIVSTVDSVLSYLRPVPSLLQWDSPK